MAKARVFLFRIATLFRERSMRRELNDEMQAHIQMLTDENLERGMTEREARSAALRSFGGVDLVHESAGRERGIPMLERILQDVKFGFRVLRRDRNFALLAIITLALGIGANTAIFSLVNAVLLRPLPYGKPDRVVTLKGGQSPPDIADFDEQSKTLSSVGGFAEWPLDLLGRGEPQSIPSALVTADLFKTLAVKPMLGRALMAGDDQLGGARVVVTSYSFWKKYLGASESVVGMELSLSGQPYTVIGVMPPGFEMPRGTAQLWVPMKVGYSEAADARGAHFMYAVARLRDGVSVQDAQAEIDVIGKRLGELYPAENRDRKWWVMPLQERVVGNVRTALLVLMSAVGCVLLIACANFASLLLAKAAARQGEMSIRAALGAQRARIVRQLLTESLMLSLAGGLLGIGLAYGGLQALLSMKPEGIPRLEAVGLDWTALAFTLGVSLLTGLSFGLIPALQASRPAAQNGHTSTRVSSEGFTRPGLRRALVVAELSVALVLLTGAGLLIRSFARLQSVDPGFRSERVETLSFQLPASRYKEIATQEKFVARLDEEIKKLPGAESAAIVSELPLGGSTIFHNLIVEGNPPVPEGKEPEILDHEITPGYFRTMNIPMLAGRDFNESDTATSELTGIVTQSFVKEQLAGRNPIGARVRWARLEKPQWITIVGVAGDTKHAALDNSDVSALYTPMSQKLQQWKRWGVVVARSKSNDPTSLAAEMKRAIWSVDPQLPIFRLQTMDETMALSVAQRRFNMLLLMTFAASALVLAVVGIYGVISYLVTQRTREIGIRMALGAQRADVLKMVFGHGAKLVGIGLAVGLAGSLVATRSLSALLFEVKTADPVTFAITAGVLVTIALAASYLPARRATKVDPMSALRCE